MIYKNDIIYISGPMSGLPDFNRPAFREMEKLLMETFGCQVLNPARITDEHVAQHHPDLEQRQLYRAYIQHDLELLFSATGVVVLEGYENSKGAMAELGVAICLRLPYYPEKYIRMLKRI